MSSVLVSIKKGGRLQLALLLKFHEGILVSQ